MADIPLKITEGIAWLMSKPKRVKIAVGGRGSAKSTGVADAMLVYADQGQRICATREFQNSIDDSVHENLKIEIERLGIEGFHVLNTEIKTHTGGEIFYKGLARNITSLKSLAGVKKLWIEEGESVSDNSLKILTPSIRSTAADEDGEIPEIWITMNRSSREDAVAKKYLSRAEDELARCGRYEDDLIMVVQMNYMDNPWFPSELEQERLDDKENLELEEYEHIWGGDYDERVDNNIIKKAWFDAAIDAHIKLGFEPSGATIFSHDPGDTGPDSKAYACRKGVVYMDIGEIEAPDGNTACHTAVDMAIGRNADLFTWDGDGMGALLREQVAKDLKGIKCEVRMYKGSGSVEEPKSLYKGLKSLGGKDKPKTNKDMFANKRAQFYMKLANRFYNTYLAVVGLEGKPKYIDPDTIISISSDIKLLNKLRSEICRIPTVNNGAGKIQLMSKPIMKTKLGIESPGMADCLAMGEEIPEPIKPIEVTREFTSLW
ncbi:MAG: PBSX family phage terminase large subunit [Nitrosomonadaceae bacterium]